MNNPSEVADSLADLLNSSGFKFILKLMQDEQSISLNRLTRSTEIEKLYRDQGSVTAYNRFFEIIKGIKEKL